MLRAARSLAHARRATRALHASRRADANIVCSDPVHPSFVSTCEARGHSVIVPSSATDPLSLREALQEAHGLVVRSATKVDEGLLAEAPVLRVIGRAGAGLDNVDVAAATHRNIPVISTPHGPTISAAELTLALLTALARRVPQAASATTPLADLVEPTGADSTRTAPSDLQGKVAGVIGLGRIGREVAAFCKAAGMHVVGYDPLLSQQVTRASGIEQLTLDELYRVSDIVTVHTPLTESTRGLVGAAELAACKPGVLLVNCARGGIVDETALLDALRSGHVAGAALDVFSVEPPTEEMAPLLQHPNVLCTPHIGASTKDASLRIATQLAVRLCDALDGRRLRGAVNSPAAEMVTQRDLIPYVGLAEKLGALQMQLLAGRLRRVVIQTQGTVVSDGEVTDLISRAALAGMLGRLLEEDVNIMNAPGLAEELGLSVALQRGGDGGSDAFGYANMVSIRFETDAGTKTLRGGVHEDGQARLVGVDDYRLDIVPEGDMLVFSNEDRPGILCNVTSVLAEAGINIANFELGRHSGPRPPLPGAEREDPAAPRTPGLALSVFSLDDPVTKQARDRLRSLDHIHDVRVASVPAWTDHVILDTQARTYPLHAETRPAVRPDCPHFGSGPTKKPPGWSLRELRPALTGRSHRSREGKARLAAAVDETHRILGLPSDYRVGIVPGSDTGAFEMAMWTMLGQRPVDVCYWDAFGKGWHTDIEQELKLDDVRVFDAGYGWLPRLSGTDPSHDIVFPWNGTTSGVCVPHGDWIAADRSGLTLCDATSAAFAMDMPWDKLDVTTFSWQKVLGGEGGHGMIILSPRAVERLESYRPPWPVPKVMRLTSDSKLIEGIFRGNTINTPSMLCVEDYSYALAWADSIGGMPALIRRSKDNLAAVEEFVLRTDWCSFLAKEVGTISNTSVCLELDGVSADQIKTMQDALESEGVAFDIGSYRDAPAGLRLWCGATVERSDLEALMPWLEWAYDVATS